MAARECGGLQGGQEIGRGHGLTGAESVSLWPSVTPSSQHSSACKHASHTWAHSEGQWRCVNKHILA